MNMANKPDNESKVHSDELFRRENSQEFLTESGSKKSANKIKKSRRDNKTDTNVETLKPRNSFKKGNTYDVFDQLQDIYGSRDNTFYKDDIEGEVRKKKRRRKKKKTRQDNDTKDRLKDTKEVCTNMDGISENPGHSVNKTKDQKKRKKRQKDKEYSKEEGKKEQKHKGRYGKGNKTVENDKDKKNTANQTFSMTKDNSKKDNSRKLHESESKTSEGPHDTKGTFINSKNETEVLVAGTEGNTDEYDDDFETDENSSECSDSESSDTEKNYSDASEESHQPQSDKTNGCDSESELNISSYEDDGPAPKDKDKVERDPSPPVPSYTPAPPMYQSPEHAPKDTDVNSNEIGMYALIYQREL